MKYLTKKWFEIQKEKQESAILDNKFISWLEETACVSMSETEMVLKNNGKGEDLDGIIESEIFQINILESSLQIKQETGEISARDVSIIENELGERLCEKMILRAVEIYQRGEGLFELHFLIEKSDSKALRNLTITCTDFSIRNK